MPFRDELLTCEQCGDTFVYRVEEQRVQEEMGFEPEEPEKCPDCRENVTSGPGLHAGVVKWYREDKHFGFITQRDGTDIFFHSSGIEGDPTKFTEENTPVWFEVTTTDRGPQAVNVHLRE
jgi:CspA family cold shock protein